VGALWTRFTLVRYDDLCLQGDADIRLDAVSDDGMPYNPVSISVGGSACLTAADCLSIPRL